MILVLDPPTVVSWFDWHTPRLDAINQSPWNEQCCRHEFFLEGGSSGLSELQASIFGSADVCNLDWRTSCLARNTSCHWIYPTICERILVYSLVTTTGDILRIYAHHSTPHTSYYTLVYISGMSRLVAHISRCGWSCVSGDRRADVWRVVLDKCDLPELLLWLLWLLWSFAALR